MPKSACLSGVYARVAQFSKQNQSFLRGNAANIPLCEQVATAGRESVLEGEIADAA